MTKLMTKVYRILLLLTFSLLFNGCGTSTVQDSTQTAVGQSPAGQSGAALTSQGKYDLANNLYSQAMLSSEPKRSQLLMQSLTLCSQVLDDPQILPQLYSQSRQLCIETIQQVSSQSLSPAEKNNFILLAAKNYLLNQQPVQALQMLEQNFNSSQVEQWSQYYQLRADALYQTDQASSAVRELMIRQDLLTDPLAIEQNQLLIWKYLSVIPDDQLEQLLQAETRTTDNVFRGWLSLSQIFRQGHTSPAFNQQISLWLQVNPSHPADLQFINKIIAARESAIFRPSQIAVLLPGSEKFVKPAQAIMDGINAAHYARPIAYNLLLRFYDSSNQQQFLDTYQEAVNNGAELIIGPLSKQNLQLLSESFSLPVPTLALNSLENLTRASQSGEIKTPSPSMEVSPPVAAPHPDALPLQKRYAANLYQFGLSPESDARRVADKAWRDGHFYAAILAPDSNWGKRMQSAFKQRWGSLGGIVADTVFYPPTAQDFSESIKGLLHIQQSNERRRLVGQVIGREVEFTPRRRQDIDMVFMAAFPKQARQIPLQIIYHHGETLPVYSTSHIVSSYEDRKNNIDIDGVYFSDMPWLLGQDENAISHSGEYPGILYQRLFTLGVDSYQIAPYIQYLRENPSESIQGESGQLSVSTDGYVIRTLPWVKFKEGVIETN